MSKCGDTGIRLAETVGSILSACSLNGIHTLKKKDGAFFNAGIRLCLPDEIDAIAGLQDRVYEHIGNKKNFVLTTREELTESLSRDVCLGVYDGEKLIAFTLMVINRDTARNLGFSLGYERQKCLKCVTNDTTFVDPDYQGYGIQRRLLEIKNAIAEKLGAEEVLATVSPENAFSLRNIISEGFEVVSEKNMYGGYRRYIVRKKIRPH